MLPKNKPTGKESILSVVIIFAITAMAVVAIPVIWDYRGKVVVDVKPTNVVITVEAVKPCRPLSTSCKITSP